MGSGGTNNSACLCLHAEKISVLEFKVASSGLKRMKNFSHAEKISVLEFKVASSGLKRMKNFSLVQRAHFPVTGLKVGTFVFRTSRLPLVGGLLLLHTRSVPIHRSGERCDNSANRMAVWVGLGLQ